MTNSPERIQPPVFPVQKVNIPEATFYRLNNGIPVYTINSGDEDVMRLEIIVRAGHIREDIPLLSSTTLLMLSEGTLRYSAEELNRLLDFYGAFMNISPEKDLSAITFFFLNKHMAKVIELAGEIIFHPAFREDEFDSLMNKRLNWFMVNREKVANMALDKFFESIFGNNPYGWQIKPEHFRMITTEMIESFHKKNYIPSEIALIVSGKIKPETRGLLNQHLGNIVSGENTGSSPRIELSGSGVRESTIKKPGAVQTAVRIGSRAINKRHPDYPGLKIVNTILGGYFGSRLMKNIREDKGFTYGIQSSLTSLDLSGYKLISAEVNPDNRNETIDEILKEIRMLQEVSIGKEELEAVRNYMSGEIVRMFDGPFATAESFRSVWEFGLDNTYYHSLSEKIINADPDEIKELTRTYYKIDELYRVTVGPE